MFKPRVKQFAMHLSMDVASRGQGAGGSCSPCPCSALQLSLKQNAPEHFCPKTSLSCAPMPCPLPPHCPRTKCSSPAHASEACIFRVWLWSHYATGVWSSGAISSARWALTVYNNTQYSVNKQWIIGSKMQAVVTDTYRSSEHNYSWHWSHCANKLNRL